MFYLIFHFIYIFILFLFMLILFNFSRFNFSKSQTYITCIIVLPSALSYPFPSNNSPVSTALHMSTVQHPFLSQCACAHFCFTSKPVHMRALSPAFTLQPAVYRPTPLPCVHAHTFLFRFISRILPYLFWHSVATQQTSNVLFGV